MSAPSLKKHNVDEGSEDFSLLRDARSAVILTLPVLALWGLVACGVGGAEAVVQSEGFSTISALFAAASLLSRQYCLNEVVHYLAKRKELMLLTDEMLALANPQSSAIAPLADDLRTLSRHEQYVRSELVVLSVLPVFMVAVLGIVFLTGNFPLVRTMALVAIVYAVVLLARMVYTSVALAEERVAQEAACKQFRAIVDELKMRKARGVVDLASDMPPE